MLNYLRTRQLNRKEWGDLMISFQIPDLCYNNLNSEKEKPTTAY